MPASRWAAAIQVLGILLATAASAAPQTSSTDDERPAWSLDGREFVFESSRSKGGDLFRMDLEDGSAGPLLGREPEGRGAKGSASRALEITYLTNEAFLLRCGEQKVLIDAFVPEPYRDYGFVPEEVWSSMVAGEPPFDGVALALVSHRHQDHFQPRAAAEFLGRHPETLLATSPEVVEHLRAAAKVPSGQIEIRWPQPREVLSLETEGIRVEFLHLPHGGARWAKIENLGHVVHLCGQRVLHIGDAFETPAVFAAYAEILRDLDVSLIPSWFFFDTDGQRVIRDFIGARYEVMMHVESRQIEDMADHFAEEDPSLVVFRRAMESRSFEP